MYNVPQLAMFFEGADVAHFNMNANLMAVVAMTSETLDRMKRMKRTTQ